MSSSLETTGSMTAGLAQRASRLVVLVGLVMGFATLAITFGSGSADASQTTCQGTVIDGECFEEVNPVGFLPCGQGTAYTNNGTVCQVLGDTTAAFVCPAGPAGVHVTVNHVTINGTEVIGSCTFPLSPICPDGALSANDACWRMIDFVADPQTPVQPQPQPGSANGRISLAYTVDCAGEGLARVSLGTPVLEDGAIVSLITVNGSATVAADIAGGAPVVVEVTATRPGDEVVVTGPSSAPLCQETSPAADVVPGPSTPAASSAAPPATAPARDAAPSEDDEPTAVATPSHEDSPAPEGQVGPGIPAATSAPALGSIAAAQCPDDHVFVKGQCLAPCGQASSAVQPCFAIETENAPVAPVAAATPVEPATGSPVPTQTSTMLVVLAVAGAISFGALALFGAITLLQQRRAHGRSPMQAQPGNTVPYGF